MILKRIAAVAAVACTLLAVVPGVAMASSSGAGQRPAPVRCPAAAAVPSHGPAVQAICCVRTIEVVRHPGRRVQVSARACRIQVLTFDMPAFSRTATEVSGPRLTVHELFIYQKHSYVIASVQGRTFTLDRLPVPVIQRVQGLKPRPFPKHRRLVRTLVKLTPFTNGPVAITGGHAFVLRGLVAIVVRVKGGASG